MRPFWQPSEPERGGGQDGEPEPSAEPMQQAQEGAEADLGRGEVALQVGQEGHLGGQGGRHDGQVSPWGGHEGYLQLEHDLGEGRKELNGSKEYVIIKIY